MTDDEHIPGDSVWLVLYLHVSGSMCTSQSNGMMFLYRYAPYCGERDADYRTLVTSDRARVLYSTVPTG